MSAPSYTRKAEGTLTVCGPCGENKEVKTATCGHCGKVVMVPSGGDGQGSLERTSYLEAFLQPKKEETHVCHCCWSLVCDVCHGHGSCKPLLRQLDEMEARTRALQSYGL